MGEIVSPMAAVSAGANLHPAGQTESGLVSRVPARALGAPPVGASRRSKRQGTGMMDPDVTMNFRKFWIYRQLMFRVRDLALLFARENLLIRIERRQ
jgi:hypothetical protein